MQRVEARHVVSIDDIFSLILASKNREGIEGVTLIGGEPFLQAEGLSVLADYVRDAGMSIIAFSGYTLEELSKGSPEQRELLGKVDALIDGPYLKDEPDYERGWIGSMNQRVFCLSNRYSLDIEYSGENIVEILVGEDDLLMNGWPINL